MPDPHPARPAEREDRRTLIQRLIEFIRPGPDSTHELMATLAEAEDKAVIGAESRVMLEGVLKLADMTAGDVMVAAPRMDLLDIEAPIKDLMYEVIRTAHSRFPVFEGDREPMGGGPGQSRGGDESGERRWSLFEGCQNEGRLVQHSDTA